LRSLAAAFEQVITQTGTEVYQQILAAHQQRDIALKETTLKMIAELHLSWFEYKAAAIMKNC